MPIISSPNSPDLLVETRLLVNEPGFWITVDGDHEVFYPAWNCPDIWHAIEWVINDYIDPARRIVLG